VLLTGQPEELVRQALLYHLTRQSGLHPGTIDLRAEFNDLDIAVLKPPADERFRPMPRPLVIVDVKRPEADPRNHEGQLFGYLTANRSEIGVLYNGRELIAYVPGQCNDWTGAQLGSLGELDDLIRRAAARPEPDLDIFQRAAAGCAESFLALAEIYGLSSLGSARSRYGDRSGDGSLGAACPNFLGKPSDATQRPARVTPRTYPNAESYAAALPRIGCLAFTLSQPTY